MDFDLPPDDDLRRAAVRRWIAEHPNPTGKQLAEAGYVVPHWPRPWGLEADGLHQIVIDEELAVAGVKRPDNLIGIGWAAPTILAAGTPEQKDRYLWPIFSGEEYWCQLFSEPDSGSDLASLSTRAVRDGDTYIVNGSKIWSSGAHHSKFGILIARTNPDVPKHKGISYFICPMDAPGVTMQPIVDMTTAHSFNQVFFDDVRLPAGLRVGDEGDGWRLAKVTLANERVGLSSGGVLWSLGPTAQKLIELVKSNGGVSDPVMRDRLASVYCEAEVLRLNQLRTLSARLAGRTPGPEASIQKIMSDDHGQRVMEAAAATVGAAGLLTGSGPVGEIPKGMQTGATEVNFPRGGGQFPDVDPIWHYGLLFSPALTLGGGTFAVQRNIVAEHVLGLPREPNVEAGLTWSESQRRRA
ncbi:MAG: acyl-CoA dehydrogenase [Acidimicrobiaceae bacterium]|nr:acyl-CoA dehydrogenase [Acidimicrobiaceae bacterium]